MIDSEEVGVGRNAARGETRKKELAEVAERMFLRHGFGDTTMNMIAKEARASKETLYRYFLSKEALFSEIVRLRASRLFDPKALACDEGPPGQMLFRLGYRLLRALTVADSLGLYRVVISESPRAPELGRLFWTQGPMYVHRTLSAWLDAAHRKGALNCRQPETAARLFIGSVISSHQAFALVSASETEISDEEIQAHVAAAVDMFLARYDAKPPR